MRTRTLAQLRNACRSDYDIPTHTVGNSLLNTWLNEGIAELLGRVLLLNPDWSLKSGTVSIVSSTQQYALPTDAYKLRGVEYTTGGVTYDIPEFAWANRNDWQATWAGGIQDLNYSVQDGYLQFYPVPNQNGSVTIWYSKSHNDLVNDDDTFDFVMGWERFVLNYAAAKFYKKYGQLEEYGASVSDMEREWATIRPQVTRRSNGPGKIRQVLNRRARYLVRG